MLRYPPLRINYRGGWLAFLVREELGSADKESMDMAEVFDPHFRAMEKTNGKMLSEYRETSLLTTAGIALNLLLRYAPQAAPGASLVSLFVVLLMGSDPLLSTSAERISFCKNAR
jgi:hypothetical protein